MTDPVGAGCLRLDEACSAVPRQPIGGTLCWRSADIDPNDVVIALDAGARAELAAMDEALRGASRAVTAYRPGQFRLPRLRRIMARARRMLDREAGVAVLDRLPLGDIAHDTALVAFWCLGNLLAANVAQKWDGTLLYDVADHGLTFGYGVRGSYTDVELPFHTDNAFGIAPPRYVGLLCIHPAAAGGVSRFCSLIAVHDRLLADDPRLLARLYRPMLWDRQAEHAPEAPRVASAPMFRWHEQRLCVRANPMLARKGYAVAEQAMDDELAEALTAFQALTDDPGFWFELPIERGQVQYVNNAHIAHYRSAFDDPEGAAHRRHLVRTWHRATGSAAYDG